MHDLGKRSRRHNSIFWLPLYLGLLGGFGSLAIDLDHWFTYKGLMGVRPLHIPLAIIACCVGIYCCTRLRRLFVGVVLKESLAFLLIIVVLVVLEFVWLKFMGGI